MAITRVSRALISDDSINTDKISDATMVTESEGIGSNDNDTTLPTSAAVKDYVDTSIANSSSGIEWISTIQTSNFTAVSLKGYFVNTTSAEVSVTLPQGTVGDQISIQDYAGTFNVYRVRIIANGSDKIQGSSEDGQLRTLNTSATLIYQDSTKGWTDQNLTTIPPPANITPDFLIIAGGGTGGPHGGQSNPAGGGGGAGGLRTTFGSDNSGGGCAASSETKPTFTIGTTYTITVGGSDTDSSISGSNITTITATKGGTGQGYSYGSIVANGGSGGGGVFINGDDREGSGTSCQGYSGGLATTFSGAGGGGSGGIGGGSTSLPTPGNGGVGTTVGITGTDIIYAAGGGGGLHIPLGSTSGVAGAGGLGDGSGTGAIRYAPPNYSGVAATAGKINSGGGGGGGASARNSGSTGPAAGGSGVVILRMDTAQYSGTTTGSPSVTQEIIRDAYGTITAEKTILTYTGSGSYTH